MGKRFFRLAIPNILSNLTIPLVGLVDTAFLGYLPNIKHLAGVALGTVLFDYVYLTFGFLRMGTTGLTAQAVGRRSAMDLHLILMRGTLFALTLGIFLVSVRGVIGNVGFEILSGDATVKEAGRSYFDARILGAPATLLNYVILGWVLGKERSDYALVMALVGNGANIVLDYFLIVYQDMGSAGAGYATALSQYLMAFVGLSFVARMTSLARFKEAFGYFWDKEGMKSLWTLNVDILIRSFFLQTAFALFLNFSSGLGTVILAANAIVLKILSVASYFIDGFAFATESLAGVFWGEKNENGLRRLLKLNCLWSFAIGVGFALLVLVNSESIYGMLTDHYPVIQEASKYSVWLLGVLGFGGLAYALDGYFLGLTMGTILRVSMVTSFVVGFLPFALVAVRESSPHLLWLSLVAFMGMRAWTLWRKVPSTWEAISKKSFFP